MPNLSISCKLAKNIVIIHQDVAMCVQRIKVVLTVVIIVLINADKRLKGTKERARKNEVNGNYISDLCLHTWSI